MSYILDALKKSEQERGHGNIPDVQTVHSAGLNYRNEKTAYWPYILIAAVLLNLLAIVYFIANKETPQNIEAVIPQATVITDTETEQIAAIQKTETESKITKAVASSNTMSEQVIVDTPPVVIVENKVPQTDKETKTAAADTSWQPIAERTDIIEFYDLPESIKQELPAIIVSAHIYSTNPAQRSIVINNNFMEEGGYVLDGLILFEITPNGAIFNYQGTLFSYGVVSGWQ